MRAVFFGILAVLILGAFPAQAKPTLSAYEIAPKNGETVFRLQTDQMLDFRIFTLENPRRVVIDLPDAAWRVPPAVKGAPTGRGMITHVRNGWPKPGVLRVVLDMNQPAVVKDAFMQVPSRANGPHYLMVVLKPQDGAKPAYPSIAAKKTAPAEPKPNFAKPQPSRLTGREVEGTPWVKKEDRRAELTQPPVSITANAKPIAAVTPPTINMPAPVPKMRPEHYVIVIDAGHGGVDPGAIALKGAKEKDITLRYARQLREILLSSGRYDVVMTRVGDNFVSLKSRVRKAQEAKGQLFISLHADSHPEPNMRGLSVYTLSEQASDKEAAALAERENKKDIIHGVDLSVESKEVAQVLIDLAQRDTKNTSAKFAELVVAELGTEAKLLRNTHRFAGFAVLKGMGIPSALVELGYLSNPQEEEMLLKEEYRAKLVNAIARAVDTYCDQYVLRPDEQ